MVQGKRAVGSMDIGRGPQEGIAPFPGQGCMCHFFHGTSCTHCTLAQDRWGTLYHRDREVQGMRGRFGSTMQPLVMRRAAQVYLHLKQKWHWSSVYSVCGWTYFPHAEGMDGPSRRAGRAQWTPHPCNSTHHWHTTHTAGDRPALGDKSQTLGLSDHPLHTTCPTPKYAFLFKPHSCNVYFSCSFKSLIKE